MSKNLNINEILNNVDKLPNMNGVGIRVINMLDDENTRLQDLSQVISSDPALTSQLLKLCNSAYFGFSREISNISDAIARLGFKTVKSLTFMTISHSLTNNEVKGYSLHQGELWKNSITCAVFSKYLAQRFNYPDIETAFVAGLLRDIGKLIIDEYVGINYGAILEKVNNEKISFCQAEEAILGLNHSCIGAKLAEIWHFPPTLVEAIQYHHCYAEAAESGGKNLQLIAIIHLADIFTMITGSNLGNDGLMYHVNMDAFKKLEIPENTISVEELLAELVEQRTEIKKIEGIMYA